MTLFSPFREICLSDNSNLEIFVVLLLTILKCRFDPNFYTAEQNSFKGIGSYKKDILIAKYKYVRYCFTIYFLIAIEQIEKYRVCLVGKLFDSTVKSLSLLEALILQRF